MCWVPLSMLTLSLLSRFWNSTGLDGGQRLPSNVSNLLCSWDNYQKLIPKVAGPGYTEKCFMRFCAMPSSIRDGLFPHGGIYSKHLETHESLWRELSVAALLVSRAVRPCIGIASTLSHRERGALLLAEAPRRRCNALASLI